VIGLSLSLDRRPKLYLHFQVTPGFLSRYCSFNQTNSSARGYVPVNAPHPLTHSIRGVATTSRSAFFSMRPLSLHASALNDEEYALFSSSLLDLASPDNPCDDDTHFEKLSVSIREARAWLRGRYSDLPVSNLNEVCDLVFYYLCSLSHLDAHR